LIKQRKKKKSKQNDGTNIARKNKFRSQSSNLTIEPSLLMRSSEQFELWGSALRHPATHGFPPQMFACSQPLPRCDSAFAGSASCRTAPASHSSMTVQVNQNKPMLSDLVNSFSRAPNFFCYPAFVNILSGSDSLVPALLFSLFHPVFL
jgi:hypothetical protein